MPHNEHLKKAPKGTSKKTDWHRADIVAALWKRGWSLRRLSVHHGYAHATLGHALKSPYPKAERAIAEAIGVAPWEIWPTRYDAQHRPLSGKGARKRVGQGRHLANPKDNGTGGKGNVQS